MHSYSKNAALHAFVVRPHPELVRHTKRQRERRQFARFVTTTSVAALTLVSSALAYEIVAPPGSETRSQIVAHAAAAGKQFAAVSSLPIVDSMANSLYWKLCPYFHSCPTAARVLAIPSTKQPTKVLATTTSPRPAFTAPVTVQHITNNTVIERVIETQHTVVEGGVNEIELNHPRL